MSITVTDIEAKAILELASDAYKRAATSVAKAKRFGLRHTDDYKELFLYYYAIANWNQSRFVSEEYNNGFSQKDLLRIQARINELGYFGCLGDGEEVEEPEEPIIIRLDTPILSSGNVTQTSAAISWTAVSNAVTYELQRATNISFTANRVTLQSNGNLTFNDSNLSADTTYYYRVRARTSSPGFADSDYRVINLKTDAIPVVTQLEPPLISSSNITTDSVTLNWTAVTNATTYQLQRATDSGFTTNLITLQTGPDRTFINTGLSADTTYYYRVKAINTPAFYDSNYAGINVKTAAIPVDKVIVYYGWQTDKADLTVQEIETSSFIEADSGFPFIIPFNNVQDWRYAWFAQPDTEPIKTNWADTVVDLNKGEIGGETNAFANPIHIGGYHFNRTAAPTIFDYPIRFTSGGTIPDVEEPEEPVVVTPEPPTLTANNTLNTLAASHAFGNSEILVSTNGAAYVPYTGIIQVGNVNRSPGYWKFKIKAAPYRNESSVVESPEFTEEIIVPVERYTLTVNLSGATGYTVYVNGSSIAGNTIEVDEGTVLSNITVVKTGFNISPASVASITMDSDKSLEFVATPVVVNRTLTIVPGTSGATITVDGVVITGNTITRPQGTVISSIALSKEGWTFTPAEFTNVLMDQNKTLSAVAVSINKILTINVVGLSEPFDLYIGGVKQVTNTIAFPPGTIVDDIKVEIEGYIISPSEVDGIVMDTDRVVTFSAVKEIDVNPLKGFVLGDSTISSYGGVDPVASYLLTGSELSSGISVLSIAESGDTIGGQWNKYNALPNKHEYGFAIIQVGLNDINFSLQPALSNLQSVINDIKTKSPGIKIIVGTFTPSDYGWAGGSWGARWAAFNEAVKGNGPNAITGVDYVASEHTDLMNDGSNYLKVEYRIDQFDLTHLNGSGKQIVANSWRKGLKALGIITGDAVTTPVAPVVVGNDDDDTLAATHPLGNSEIVVSSPSGYFEPYTGPIEIGNINLPAGAIKFKTRAAIGRNESAIVDSPAFVEKNTLLPGATRVELPTPPFSRDGNDFWHSGYTNYPFGLYLYGDGFFVMRFLHGYAFDLSLVNSQSSWMRHKVGVLGDGSIPYPEEATEILPSGSFVGFRRSGGVLTFGYTFTGATFVDVLNFGNDGGEYSILEIDISNNMISNPQGIGLTTSEETTTETLPGFSFMSLPNPPFTLNSAEKAYTSSTTIETYTGTQLSNNDAVAFKIGDISDDVGIYISDSPIKDNVTDNVLIGFYGDTLYYYDFLGSGGDYTEKVSVGTYIIIERVEGLIKFYRSLNGVDKVELTEYAIHQNSSLSYVYVQISAGSITHLQQLI